jgi:hypothetical protein
MTAASASRFGWTRAPYPPGDHGRRASSYTRHGRPSGSRTIAPSGRHEIGSVCVRRELPVPSRSVWSTQSMSSTDGVSGAGRAASQYSRNIRYRSRWHSTHGRWPDASAVASSRKNSSV